MAIENDDTLAPDPALDATADVRSALDSDAGLEVTAEAPARYDLRREFGRGGQAVVYLAFDAHIGREVAFKQQLESSANAQRFLQEGRIAGTLEHPGIVPVYEIGQRSDGSYYYTQKLVRGKTLRQALAECAGLAERMRLLPQFLGVCQAVAYAHSRGVIHRDLKPDNVMIGEFGEAIVLDWGLAKRLGDVELPGGGTSGPASDSLTRDGTLLGTPLYMSPEQAEGRIAALDRRSDVFSLGAMLYELLVGKTPFAGATVAEVIEKVSSGVMAPMPVAELRLAPELVAVAVRALAKDPAARFADAQQLANELADFLAGKRIASYEYSSLELLRRFVRKNKLLVALSAGLLLSVLVGAALVVRSDAQSRAHLAAARRNLADALLQRAAASETEGRFGLAAGYYAMAGMQVDEPRARWGAALAAARAPETKVESGPLDDAEPSTAVISEDGRWLAMKFRNRFAICDLSTGKWVYEEPTDGSASFLAASTSGYLVSATKQEITVRRWESPSTKRSWQAAAWVRALTFLSDGRLVLARMDGKVEVCSLEGACRAYEFAFRPLTSIAASTDGRFVIIANLDEVVRIDVASMRVAWRQPFGASHIRGLTIKENLVMVSSVAGDLAVLNADTGLNEWRIGSIDRMIGGLVTGPDGLLIVDGFDGETSLMRLPARRPFATLARTGAASRVADHVVTFVGYRGERQTLDLRELRSRWNLLQAHGSNLFALAPCGSHAWLSEGWDRDVLLWQAGRSDETVKIELPIDPAGVDCIDDGRTLITANQRGLVTWHSRDGKPQGSVDVGPWIVRMVALPSGDVVVADGKDQVIRVARDSHVPTKILGKHDKRITGLALLDARRVATVSTDGTARIWDVDGKELLRIPAASWPQAIAAAPDGAAIATSGYEPWIRIWDTRSGQLLRSIKTDQMVTALAWSPDGALIAADTEVRSVALFDARSGERYATIRGPLDQVSLVRWSSDSTELAIADTGGALMLLRFDPKEVALAPSQMLDEVKRRFHLVQDGVELHTSLAPR